jgi:hypothetical protein
MPFAAFTSVLQYCGTSVLPLLLTSVLLTDQVANDMALANRIYQSGQAASSIATRRGWATRAARPPKARRSDVLGSPAASLDAPSLQAPRSDRGAFADINRHKADGCPIPLSFKKSGYSPQPRCLTRLDRYHRVAEQAKTCQRHPAWFLHNAYWVHKNRFLRSCQVPSKKFPISSEAHKTALRFLSPMDQY